MRGSPEELSMKAKAETETRVRIANSQTEAMRLFLEPWGREYVMHPEDEFVFAFHATTTAEPEIVITADGVEVWAWSGATVEVYKNGKELTEYVPEDMPTVAQK
jgi:hypothetical protein